MIDLSKNPAGELGDGTWFSTLFLEAVQSHFTGGILIQAEDGVRAAIFQDGHPGQVGGTAFTSGHLGSLLMQTGKLEADPLKAALATQAGQPNYVPLGVLLVQGGVPQADVDEALRSQLRSRLRDMLGLNGGRWQAASGENERSQAIALPTDGWALFFELLMSSAADTELKALASALLGKSVRLKPSAGLPELENTPEAVAHLEHYLEKSRKPDQLERAIGKRRLVRGYLRALQLLQAMEVHPASAAIPIPKATLLRGTSLGSPPKKAKPAPASAPGKPSKPSKAPPRRQSTHSRMAAPRPPHPMEAELRARFGKMKDQNHFEVLGATEDTSPQELRGLFTQLAKRFHPDAFPADLPEDLRDKGREISARINEAYQALSNPERRASYTALLKDDRIKGDLRQAERVKEAEVKAQMATVYLNKRDFKNARDYFKAASELDPTSGQYLAQYAWAFLTDASQPRPGVFSKAVELLIEALERDPKQAGSHYYLARAYRELGQTSEMEHHLAQAVELDPQHTEAQRELRLARGRRSGGDAPEKKSTFSKLFGR